MISELLMTYIFDRLDKQIIKRIPYALLISLIIYLILDIKPLLLPLSIISIIIFLLSTILFNTIINNALGNILLNIDFQKLLEKLADIFEGKTSLLDDIKAQENWKIITIGALSGTFFTILLTTTFLMILNHFMMGKELATPIVIILFIYLYQDIAETDLLKEYQAKETETPFLQDIAETYIVSNSLKSFPIKSFIVAALKFAGRIIGPLSHLTAPKIHSDTLLIYNNPEIISLIKEQLKKDKLYLKHEQGQSIDNFFTNGLKHSESITFLKEKPPKENFPYLFDPNYLYSEKRRKNWTAVSIIEQEKVKGYIFIHMFKGVYVKSRLRKSPRKPIEQEARQKETLLFIFLGERKYLQYLKTRIEIVSTKYPQNLIDMEYSQ